MVVIDPFNIEQIVPGGVPTGKERRVTAEISADLSYVIDNIEYACILQGTSLDENTKWYSLSKNNPEFKCHVFSASVAQDAQLEIYFRRGENDHTVLVSKSSPLFEFIDGFEINDISPTAHNSSSSEWTDVIMHTKENLGDQEEWVCLVEQTETTQGEYYVPASIIEREGESVGAAFKCNVSIIDSNKGCDSLYLSIGTKSKDSEPVRFTNHVPFMFYASN
eukprot:gb/GECH01005617.1/.p1 GENE.gb/GECH01005617.1/~~gb/GECH01005617.1/.p1  ORF type:complete len:221 (+),score=42.81 gb/GECH01005617.1/:1-663(+)